MKHILATLAFYVKYEGWHSFSTTPAQLSAIKRLEREGFLEVAGNQARFTGKVFVN